MAFHHQLCVFSHKCTLHTPVTEWSCHGSTYNVVAVSTLGVREVKKHYIMSPDLQLGFHHGSSLCRKSEDQNTS